MIEEKECQGYTDCNTLNAFCTYFEFSMTTFKVINKCKCVSGFDHIAGLASYRANDGLDYTSRCAHISGKFVKVAWIGDLTVLL